MSARVVFLSILGGLLWAVVAPAQIDPNLIGWWNFEEGEGTVAVDSSGYGHHGTLVGDPQWVPGYDGLALDLDGEGDYVETGKAAVGTWPSRGDPPRTVALWVYTRSFNGGGVFTTWGATMNCDGYLTSNGRRRQRMALGPARN